MNSGNQSDRSIIRRQLGKRDRAILQDVIRYRVITNDITHRLYFADQTANSVTKTTHRLSQSGWLACHEFIDGRNYFTAGAELCKQFALPMGRRHALGPQALSTYIALVQYCTSVTPRLALLTYEEIGKYFPWMPDKHKQVSHVLGSNLDGSLELIPLRTIRVDLGGTAAHIAHKCIQDSKARSEMREYRRLLAGRQWVHVVLTTTEPKRLRIMQELKKREWPTGTRFDIVVISELSSLLLR